MCFSFRRKRKETGVTIKARRKKKPCVFCHDGDLYSTAECDMSFRSMNNFRTYFKTKKGNYFSCDSGLDEHRHYNEEIDGVNYLIDECISSYSGFKVANEQEFKIELALTDIELYEEMYGKPEYA